MQIVIDIPEWKYSSICEGIEASKRCGVVGIDHDIHEAIYNGIILPKEHGRLIDASKLKVELECGIRAGNYEKGYEKYAHINSMDDCVDAVQYAETIIEANKTSEET